MTPEHLAAIKARAEAATPGPWDECGSVIYAGDMEATIADVHNSENALPKQDALFIAHARTDIPALLAEVARLRAELEAAKLSRQDGEEPAPDFMPSFRRAVDSHNAAIDRALRGEP